MATLISKNKSITMEFSVRNQQGFYDLIVEISVNEIVFRAMKCRTECYIQQAKLNPQRIANCIYALEPNTTNSEVDQIVRHIMLELN